MSTPSLNKPDKSRTDKIEEAVRAHNRELFGFLRKRLNGRRELSEDLQQEIYVRLLRFSNPELVRDPRAYLFRVARNVLYDMSILEERERQVLETSADGIADTSVDDPSRRTDVERDLERILSQLPPLYRAVLLLRTSHGLSYPEIAQQLSISEHTVKKYLHLALVKARLISLEIE